MKRIHLYTTIGLIFFFTGIALFPSQLPFLASIYTLLAYFCSIKEVATYTSNYQFTVVTLSAVLLGISVDASLTSLPLLSIGMFFVAAGSTFRIAFFKTFGYTQHSWFEVLIFFLSLSLYLVGNILQPTNWASWAFPIILIFFQGILAYGIIKDKKQLTSFTKGGYKIAIGKEAPEFALSDREEKNSCINNLEKHWWQSNNILWKSKRNSYTKLFSIGEENWNRLTTCW